MKQKHVFIITINGQTQPLAYTSLKALCDKHDINYNTLIITGKMRLIRGEEFILIQKLEVKKIVGRGRDLRR